MIKRAILTSTFVLSICMAVGGMSSSAQTGCYTPQVQPPVYYQQYSEPQHYQYQYHYQCPQPVPPVVYYPEVRYCGGCRNNECCMYKQALEMVHARQYRDAIQAFTQFLHFYPHSSLADNAIYWTGECYYAMKQYRVALSYFEKIPYQYPHGNKTPDALLKTALSYFSLRNRSRACQALNQLLTRFPASESAHKAHRWTHRCYGRERRGDCHYSCCQRYAPRFQGQSSYYDDCFPKNY
ncbi:tol-pal system protein YbgF [candidate division KSB3 bacterium]|uniref:Tol-pal system protein YbgF n=1 Tax=candidate division KSB3 bacterium TaxID=2044937 RepID=A0A2G6E5A3_9BACT|nr:MAG: tol-pal system protein YbgF [candidate division KSB3 bacterium]PIE29745.1 MAG: tol-pal system protein YbgF [candidate division KSB3 bacterium]